MESMNERQRFLDNPKRLLRCAIEMGKASLVGLLEKMDDALDVDFDPEEKIYKGENPSV